MVEQSVRERMLIWVPWFVERAARIEGVRRIALLGSILTTKENPKDVDFLVTIDDEMEVEPLATLGRKLKGRMQQFSHGADIFLADPQGTYIGRTCQWKECGFGIRVRCDALNCGRRPYLHDDVEAISLSAEVMRAAIEVWPRLEMREGVAEDLVKTLTQNTDV